MQRRRIPGTDLEVSPFCYGGASFGASLTGKALSECIGVFRDSGGNFFDTAHCYEFWLPSGAGASERALGEYVRSNGRSDLVIATKGGHPQAPGYRKTDQWLAPYRIQADIDDSLGRLDFDAIDLFWLHRDDTRLPVGEIIEMLNGEIGRGRIRHIGASNWRVERIAEANAYAAQHGLQGFIASQPEWSLAYKSKPNPDPQTDLLHGTAMLFLEDSDVRWHERTRFPVIPYTSTAGGYFASGGRKAMSSYDNPTTRGRLARACALGDELGVTAGQVALAWLLNQEFPVFPIIGTQNPDHLRECLGAATIRLSPQQMASLAE